MNGCMTCGGFGGHHDPVAHDEVPEIEDTPCDIGCHVLCCSDCGCPCHDS